MTVLSEIDREILSLVLEPRPDLTRRRTPALLSLSLYSSELKGLAQTYGSLAKVHEGKPLGSDVAAARYFNTLKNNGLAEGSRSAPTLTRTGEELRAAVAAAEAAGAVLDPEFWNAKGVLLELPMIRSLMQRMIDGPDVSGMFRETWFNAQTFIECIPIDALGATLENEDKLLQLFKINSVGWEVARYFRLKDAERAEFDAAHAKTLRADFEPGTAPIDGVADLYRKAASQYQSDVRFRIRNFLGAFAKLQSELGANFPRLSRNLALSRSVNSSVATSRLTSAGGSGDGAQGIGIAPSAKPLDHPHQVIISGCPGSGKSYRLEEMVAGSGARVFRTQFHPETSYYDFVGAYRPQPVYEGAEPVGFVELDLSEFELGRPMIDYRFVAGPMIRALVYALSQPDENVVVQIEELNRGNPAAIFGDVLQLLDRNESGQSRYPVAPTVELLAHVRAATGLALDEIRLPSNLYLWASMNSADQGVYPIDSAFRRRWSYQYMGYSIPCNYAEANRKITYGGKIYDWDDFRSVVNERLIELNIHEDKLVGPYFLTSAQLASASDVLQKLFLYLWDDVLRFRQHELFSVKSFSEVATQWVAGAGSPLSINDRLQRLRIVHGDAPADSAPGETPPV